MPPSKRSPALASRARSAGATAVKLGRPLAGRPAALALIAACFVAVALGRISLLIVMPIAIALGVFAARKELL